MNLFIIFVLEAGKLSLSILTLVIFGAKVQTILAKEAAVWQRILRIQIAVKQAQWRLLMLLRPFLAPSTGALYMQCSFLLPATFWREPISPEPAARLFDRIPQIGSGVGWGRFFVVYT
ncbi:MAG: hypothetical protein IKT47_01515 [Oscillospiraceae bacterium]|nr:hypothetical protein [Oscillospiraceae bacterium]